MTPITRRTPSMKRHSSPRCSTPCDRLWRPCPALRTQGRHPAMAQRGAWKARRLRWWMTPPARPRAARRGALRVGRAGDVPILEALVGFQGLRLTCASETRKSSIRPLQNRDFKEVAGCKNRVRRSCVSDCVEIHQNGQDENVAFFWHQICCGARLRDSESLAMARDTKKTGKKKIFLSGCQEENWRL